MPKQSFVSPINWNNPLPETGESYTLTISKHLDAEKKYFLDVEGIYNT